MTIHAIIGYLIVIVLMYCLIKGKAAPIPLFCFIPIVGAFIAGYSALQINGFVVKGMGTVLSTAVLLSFSVIYFVIMNELGIFDPIVDWLVKKAGTNVVAVTVVTAIVAILSHIDGATATTVLITVPSMLPLYKRLKISPLVLLTIVTLGMGVMNLLPWGGPTARVAAVLGVDANELWRALIPTQIFGAVCTIVVAAILGISAKKRGAGQNLEVEDADGQKEFVQRTYTKRSAFNLVLTLVLIGLLSWGKVQAYILFMFATGIALLANYPTLKAQDEAIKKGATPAFLIAATMMAAGVFVGILNQTPMMKDMASVFIAAFPAFLLKYIHIIVGFLGAPIGMATGTDAFFFGIVPLVIAAAKSAGVSAESVGFASLLGKNVGLMISPLTPATFMAIGLANVELKDHIRFAFPWVMLISGLTLAFGVVTGLIGI